MKRKLRIGFIVPEHMIVAAWYEETISLVRDDHEIFLLKIDEPPVSKLPTGIHLFKSFEDRWFRNPYDASRPVELSTATFAGEISLKGNYLQPDAVQYQILKNLELDLIYCPSYEHGQKENLSDAAAFGLWYIRFGYDRFLDSALPAFWEVMTNARETGSYLVMHKGGQDYILYEGVTLTVPFSVKNNFNSIAWRTASYLRHRARTLSLLYDERFTKNFVGGLHKPANVYGIPSGIRMSWLFFRNTVLYLRNKLQSRFASNRFALLFSKQEFSMENVREIPFKILPLSQDQFMADPFVIDYEDRQYVFFEEYLYSKSKAHISVMEYVSGKEPGPPKVVLEKPYHLSYPFVFKWEDEFYMVPESSSNGTVDLYRASKFPYQWEFVRHLFENTALIDATLFFHEDQWWLFANSSNHPFTSTNDQLFLYYSDNLLSGEWMAHPKNPVATHIGNCRPAGRIFRKDGKIFRPAQNNASLQYGYGLRINEIEVLTRTEYREKEVGSVFPEAIGLKAIHHLDFTDNLVLMDGIPIKNITIRT